MKVEFIRHASILIDCGEDKILCDPWFTGTAFDDGWKHVNNSDLDINDLDFNYIWYSHEHPDHFSVSDLKRLKRKDITILFQETMDNKVKNFCKKEGFKVIELEHLKSYELNQDLNIINGTDGFDSWLCVKHKGKTVLNLNDCRLDSEENLSVVKNTVGNIDGLYTQFGYANWAGNDGDSKGPEIARRILYAQIKNQIEILKPEAIIPFASYVFFCHEENSYWNSTAVEISESFEKMNQMHNNVCVTYPNDIWTVGEDWDISKSYSNIEKYTDDLELALSQKLCTSETYGVEILHESFVKMITKIKKDNNYDSILSLGLKPSIVHITDLDLIISFDITTDKLEIVDEGSFDVSMSSNSFKYLMDHKWGRGTIMINGRFSANYSRAGKFWQQTMIYYANNLGKSYPETLSKNAVLNGSNYTLELMREWDL